jgi:tripartite ATP-independent transporter DctP family solute receptor
MRFLALVAVVAALLAAAPVQAETITVKLAHAASSSHPFNKLCEMFRDDVAKRTGGKVEVQIFGDRELGDDRQVLEATVAGTIDASLASSVLFSLVVKKPAFDALQLPFLISSYENLGKLLISPPAQAMLASLDSVGLKGLSFGEAGERHFLSSKGPVRKLEDFQGLKTRIVPVPLHKAIWEAVGAKPVGVAYGEVYASMQTKVIDAVEFNIASVETEKLWETAKYLSLTGHYFWPGVITYNKAKFDALPMDVQEAMIQAGHDITVGHVAFVEKAEGESAERLKQKGVQIVKFEELAQMRARMKPIIKKWSAKDPLIAQFVAEANRLEKQ